MSEKLLELKNVTIKFGGVTALNEVNFHVNKGEICALIGPNGAGKTTVFNVVTGVYPITSGEITFKGQNLAGLKRHQVTKAGLARTFQNVRLFGDMTALENVITATDVHKKTGLLRALIGTPLNRREEKESKERAHELLELMGINHRSDQLAKNLPYGDQRRLEIARALGTEPEVLLLDEPLEGLAPIIVEELLTALKTITRREGISAIIVEQHPQLILSISDHALVLERGQVVLQERAEVLLSQPALLEKLLGVQ